MGRSPEPARPPGAGDPSSAGEPPAAAGPSGARGILLTLLGEFVLPRAELPVWTRALVGALGELGVEEKSARQALARTAAAGLLDSERVGRRVRWRLTPEAVRLLADGAERIYSFGGTRGGPAGAWDGRWSVLLVSVPEARRELRRRLRTRLNWAGYGTPQAGVWICPDPGREPEAELILRQLGLSQAALSFTGGCGALGPVPAELARRAWDLDLLERRYEEFIDRFGGAAAPRSGQAALRAQTELVHAWRRFPFLDPGLPPELLPVPWTGARAAGLFHRLHESWAVAAQGHWSVLAGG